MDPIRYASIPTAHTTAFFERSHAIARTHTIHGLSPVDGFLTLLSRSAPGRVRLRIERSRRASNQAPLFDSPFGLCSNCRVIVCP